MEAPPTDSGAPRRLVLAATTCAAVVLASQLAGKAARDAIFLQRFAVTNLPLLIAVSAALAVGVTFFYARRMSRGNPIRLVQITNLVSAVLLVIEYLLLDHYPRPVATLIFMHQMLLGPILVSGFWSVMSECFDPRTARRVLGTVGTGATVGAVIGAVIAERVAAMAGTNALLLAIAGLQLVAMWRLHVVSHGCKRTTPPEEEPVVGEGWAHIKRISLLRRLALITIIVTVSAAALDYVFKAHATAAIAPDDLARVFALFHGVVGVLTAFVQWVLGRWALQRFGLARTLATLPGAVIAFGVTAVLVPGIGPIVALRGAENVVRNSLYREAYEVFYTPLLAHERRTTKTVIDVGVERFGDVLGGLLVIAILAFVVPSTLVLLVIAIGLSGFGVIVALKAQHSYVEALERSLVAHAIELDDQEPRDRTTRNTLEMVAQRTSGTSGQMAKTSMRWRPFKKRPPHEPERGQLDPTLRRLGELTSNNPVRIRQVLAEHILSPAGVAYAVPLLAKPELADAVMPALRKVAGACIGQLADAVRDPLLPIAVRTQLPALIVEAATTKLSADEVKARVELARAGLIACLADPEFEIRAKAAEGLAKLHEHDPRLKFDEAAVFDGIRRELAVDPAIWKALHEAKQEAAQVALEGGPPSLSREVEHLATLLALVLPADPIRTAFVGLHSEDPTLRGVALEYLDNVLPPDIRERMWTLFAIEQSAVEKRPIEDVLTELLKERTRRKEAEDLKSTQIDLLAAKVVELIPR
ncbi:MAG: hypothetical protein M3619_14355 [Myxococcota bacterium]|nr:hypothetical protein [Myxococcota bacterium]